MNHVRQSLAPGLYLVGVPIGTARDITLRALDVLASADTLAAEDTRALRHLMGIHGIALEGRRIVALHDHSRDSVIADLVEQIGAGRSVAYASEAGMPLIADPGFELVRAVRQAGLAVTAAPGPSAVPTALALGGLPTDAFYFAGFLPSQKSARRKALVVARDIPATLVWFESPRRLGAALRDAAEVLGGDRKAAVCRELTKKFEEVKGGSLSELAAEIGENPVKGEIVLLVGRAGKPVGVNEKFVDDMIIESLKTMSVKDAAQHVAAETGQKKRDVYQRALALAKQK